MYIISEIKRNWFFLIIFAIILSGCSSSPKKEKWELELLEEVPYDSISSNFIGTGYAPINFITESEINFFAYDKQCFLDLNTLQFESFGSRGMGPGEFKSTFPSQVIAIEGNRYCVDQSKMCLMIFNAQNEFLKEIKLDYKPISIFLLQDNKLGIAQAIYSSNEKLVNVYSLDGKFIEKIVPAPKSLYGYPEDIRIINFLYEAAEYFPREDWIYIFIGPIPLIHKYNLKTKESEFIDYKKQLSFEPTKPVIRFTEGQTALLSKFHLFLVQKHKDYLIFKATSGDKKMKFHLVKFNFINDKFVMIEISEKKFKLTLNSLAIYDNKLYEFDDYNEILSIYQIHI